MRDYAKRRKAESSGGRDEAEAPTPSLPPPGGARNLLPRKVKLGLVPVLSVFVQKNLNLKTQRDCNRDLKNENEIEKGKD
jgi:hypothetical protein